MATALRSVSGVCITEEAVQHIEEGHCSYDTLMEKSKFFSITKSEMLDMLETALKDFTKACNVRQKERPVNIRVSTSQKGAIKLRYNFAKTIGYGIASSATPLKERNQVMALEIVTTYDKTHGRIVKTAYPVDFTMHGFTDCEYYIRKTYFFSKKILLNLRCSVMIVPTE